MQYKIRILKSKWKMTIIVSFCLLTFSLGLLAQNAINVDGKYAEGKMINKKANGFKGIWYMNQPSNDEYVYKYSGGMALYPANHRPFAIYSKKNAKTFFCYGGTDAKNSTLFHCISYFDHSNKKVANPTIVLDKGVADAHDNPVMSIDDKGYIWIFSTSHGPDRPSYITRSIKPFDIKSFQLINSTEIVNGKDVPFTKFSYFQVYYVKGKGFMALFTRYKDWNNRVIGYNTSIDGEHWNEWKIIAHIEQGHYQVSTEADGRIGVAFDYHPQGAGLNYRTNLYYLETTDFGKSWHTASKINVQLPLTQIDNIALVKDFAREKLNCYLLDISFDKHYKPVILVISSKGYQPGPINDPRTLELFHFSKGWRNNQITTSKSNYDMGSLYIEGSHRWKIIAPTDGPQIYNPGGEVVFLISDDVGKTWEKRKQLTMNSLMNHNYIRKPINAHPDFYGLWADGNGRKPSESNLYFCNKGGDVFKLPRETTEAMITPEDISITK